jgi:hypothetical protein
MVNSYFLEETKTSVTYDSSEARRVLPQACDRRISRQHFDKMWET